MRKITSGLLASAFLLLFVPALAAEPLPDYITKQIGWEAQDGSPQSPIHVTLLPDSRLFFFEAPFTMTPTPFWQWRNEDLPDKVTVTINRPPLPLWFPGVQFGPWTVIDTITCAGHTLAEDGSLMVVGGMRLVSDKPVTQFGDYAAVFGLSIALSFNPASQSWSTLAPMIGSGQTDLAGPGVRWYPTATRLANGKTMVTGGVELVLPVVLQNRSVEVYDPTAGGWTLLSGHQDTPPAIYNRDYSHVFQLPARVAGSFDILMLGEFGQPVLMSTDGPQRWRVSTQLRPGAQAGESSNYGTSSALLPIRLEQNWGYSNGAIVMAGGQHGTAHEHSIDVYDPVQDRWLARIDMGIGRHHPSTVLLPDSRVLILAGHNDSGSNPGYAQYLDPANGFSLTRGAVEIPETRGYHTITVLLPDGRVFLGSGSDDGKPGSEKPNFRYYYPDYMGKSRPGLLAAQETLQVGQYFWSVTAGKTHIAELVLVSLGSMTHSYDMNQRLVQVPIAWRGDLGEHSYQIGQAPASAEQAPPGHYMLFALDENRVPSVAKVVRLTR